MVPGSLVPNPVASAPSIPFAFATVAPLDTATAALPAPIQQADIHQDPALLAAMPVYSPPLPILDEPTLTGGSTRNAAPISNLDTLVVMDKLLQYVLVNIDADGNLKSLSVFSLLIWRGLLAYLHHYLPDGQKTSRHKSKEA
jgi:hypothetical protein